ncbi:hypothetical protein V499_05355 [Pseudogymnoascus sp. VKM F-103]|uniref:Leucine carboxyl methyltransferase 1 n=1 Tax=Pseudogymnoascus verrucosus TaxID=342668 RepID=A0A1B8GGI0_9PEZI|nr:carboxy methyl transferase for protein phosphatase 2A [Pseudogymnoascus verrucosus]KFY74608.1 hypothetical protein V499_05355 [Pseudogymnoascus sp. VKM F-103]OBT94936.1 carboxy methyl transferase for protein phosphatase 2A [Pseudogymnoascus verrucosus]
MAAPEIPNLLSMRGNRSRGGGRGRGGSSSARGAGPDRDKMIRETDTDANGSRRSAVACGYLEDPYVSEFVADLGTDSPALRMPIINRGTYVRTIVLDRLIENFINAHPSQNVQIISLGAGTDTRYFRYLDRGHKDQILYHELDFPIISANKLAFVNRSDKLAPPGSEFNALRAVPDHEPEKKMWGYFTDGEKKAGYLFHPVDLRSLPAEIDNIRTDLPTLLVSECCLCYLTTEQADAVLNFFTSRIPTIGTVIYEPTNPTSAFGRVMTSNLAARNLAMPSISTYDSLDAQLERLRAAGLDMFQEGASISWLWDNWIEDEEKVRLGQMQMFDEEEEWRLLGRHYLVVWGAREQRETEGAFGGWDFLEGEEERRIRETGEE